MRAAPNPRTLTGWFGASPHVLRFPPAGFPPVSRLPAGSLPFVRLPLVSLRPAFSGLFPSAVARFRFPFGFPPGSLPLSNLHVSAAVRRFRRRWSRAAGTKVTSPAATTSPGSRDPPALQMGSGWEARVQGPRAVAANLYQGSRSEYLAQYVFSSLARRARATRPTPASISSARYSYGPRAGRAFRLLLGTGQEHTRPLGIRWSRLGAVDPRVPRSAAVLPC